MQSVQFVILIVIICSSIIVYYDARALGIKRGLIHGFFDMEPLEWGLTVAGLWPLVFPFYFLMRSEYISLVENYQALGSTNSGGESTERSFHGVSEDLMDKIVIGWACFCLFGAVVCLFFVANELGNMSLVGGKIGLLLRKILNAMNWGVVWYIAITPATLVFLATRKYEKNVIIIKKPEKIVGETKPCPFCGELIGKKAIHCRFCAKDLVKTPKIPSPKLQTAISGGIKASSEAVKTGVQFKAGSDENNIEVKDWLTQGTRLLKMGKLKEAIITFSHAIREDGKNGQGYYARAVAYSKSGEKDKAMIDLRKSAELGYGPAKKRLKK
ncbi:MAG: hypothetical protein OEM02_08900 [Desulfobulbaceae bacterium]|nr:hypothetical protein [Desulfobulbaceae bacterium]